MTPFHLIQTKQSGGAILLGLYTDYGVATGDVYVSIRISGILGQLGKPTQLRIGSDYTFRICAIRLV